MGSKTGRVLESLVCTSLSYVFPFLLLYACEECEFRIIVTLLSFLNTIRSPTYSWQICSLYLIQVKGGQRHLAVNFS